MAGTQTIAQSRAEDAGQIQAALDVLGPDAKHIAVYTRTTQRAARAVVQRRMPADAAACAQRYPRFRFAYAVWAAGWSCPTPGCRTPAARRCG